MSSDIWREKRRWRGMSPKPTFDGILDGPSANFNAILRWPIFAFLYNIGPADRGPETAERSSANMIASFDRHG